MNPGDGQLSLELFPEVDVAAACPQLEPRCAEPARVQATPADEASVVAATQSQVAATAPVDAVFRALAVVALPGYSRPMIRARDYLELIENYTFRDDRVRPSGRVA